MIKEYFDEKFSQLSNKLNYIESRINHVEDSVNLGTFDAVILTLMIFAVGLGLSLISLGIPNLLKFNPTFLVGFMYLLVLIIPIFSCIYGYVLSIVEKDGRFKRKIFTLTILHGLIAFVFGVWILLALFWLYENYLNWWGAINDIAVYIGMGIVLISSILYTRYYVYKTTEDFFKKSFKHIIRKRLKEINNKKRRIKQSSKKI